MQCGGLRTKDISRQLQPGKPLVTVITVVYNGEKSLEKTILSVINQTYPNIEYIIVDGGSTDSTVDCIKKHEDKIDYWISEPDKGIYDAMNKGIDLSHGKWLNFMNDSDCFYNEKVLEEIFSGGKEYKNLVYGNTVYTINDVEYLRYPNLKTITYRMPFRHQSCFIDSDLMKHYRYDTRYRYAADFNLIYNMHQDGMTFMYVDVTVSRCGMDEGYTVQFPARGYLERLKVKGEKFYYPQNILPFFDHLFRQVMKNMLPRKLVHALRIFLNKNNRTGRIK